MNDNACEAMVYCTMILVVGALYAFLIWADHQEKIAKINAGQKVEQPK